MQKILKLQKQWYNLFMLGAILVLFAIQLMLITYALFAI